MTVKVLTKVAIHYTMLLKNITPAVVADSVAVYVGAGGLLTFFVLMVFDAIQHLSAYGNFTFKGIQDMLK